MPKRKPSVSRLIKGLWRMAHEAESKAVKLRALGFDDRARGSETAANEFSGAALQLESTIGSHV
jgi:hypothetical protein